MESSSESDSFDRGRRRRSRGRNAYPRPNLPTDIASGEAGGISEKINTLASTLQDTSRDLNRVDQMLGQYRENTDDQAEAMAMLRENLEESINQLQSQRQQRSAGAPRSDSASTLHTSDLQSDYDSENQRFHPTSPLKDYGKSDGAKRRSRSASVRFRDSSLAGKDAHDMHQSLRDLRSDQLRLGVDLDREILRRNRCDIDTRRAVESLAEHLTTSQRQDSVSSRVERRLEEMEREMQTGRQTGRQGVAPRRPDPRGSVSDKPAEVIGRRPNPSRAQDNEDSRSRLLRTESENAKMELELERARRLLDQSEGGKDALLQQVEDMRTQLLRTGKEKLELERQRLSLQREISQLSTQPRGYMDREQRGPDLELERELQELRAHLNRNSVLTEVEELRKTVERKERERIQLSTQVEELSSDLARREQHQLRMLEQLKELQGRAEAWGLERSRVTQRAEEAEATLQEAARKREELKARAQEAVRQWRVKGRRLEKELEEQKGQALMQSDKAQQVEYRERATKEKECAQAQLKALTQQADGLRRELAEVLARLARREEELHRRDVELSETRQRHLALEQEVRDVRDTSAALEEESQRQATLTARLKEENQRLEDRAEVQARRSQMDQEAMAELQAALKDATSGRALLADRLAEDEASRREVQRTSQELQARLSQAHEESTLLGQQLELEREVHQKELASLKATAQGGRARLDREIQETLRLCAQERDEMAAHLKDVKAEAVEDKEAGRALRSKLERMKEECDKLSEEGARREEAHSVLRRKYALLKQELDDRVKTALEGEERRHGDEEATQSLEERLSRVEAERESILSTVGEEIDAACRSLSKDAQDRLQAIAQIPGLQKDPHRWLAETKTKLRWLCEEVREREERDTKLRKQLQQSREQHKHLKQSRDGEQRALLQRLEHQESLLDSFSTQKKELLEKTRRKDDEMRHLQDRILDLETSTRVALDHLESVPEKLSLMEGFKDLEETQRQREMVQQRYAKYKEIVGDLQHQLDESKRRIQEYRDEKLDATSRSLRLAALSSSLRAPQSTFMTSSLLSASSSPYKCQASPHLDSSPVNGANTLTDHLNM
ncbi:centrosomal protein of 128 kDa [Aplochiton taeniatus]